MPIQSEVDEVMAALRTLMRSDPKAAAEMTKTLGELLVLLIEIAEAAGSATGKMEPYPEGSFKAAFEEYVAKAKWSDNRL